MKFVAMRELKINPSGVLNRLKREDVIVTRNGKPAAAMIMIDEDLLEDFIYAHHPSFMKGLEEARREYLRKGGVDHETMRRRILARRG